MPLGKEPHCERVSRAYMQGGVPLAARAQPVRGTLTVKPSTVIRRCMMHCGLEGESVNCLFLVGGRIGPEMLALQLESPGCALA